MSNKECYMNLLTKARDAMVLITKEVCTITSDEKYVEDKALYESLIRIKDLASQGAYHTLYVKHGIKISWKDAEQI